MKNERAVFRLTVFVNDLHINRAYCKNISISWHSGEMLRPVYYLVNRKSIYTMVTNMRIFLTIFVRGIFIDFVCINDGMCYTKIIMIYIYIFVKSKTVDDKVFVLCLLYTLYIQKVFLSRFFTKKKKKTNKQTTSNENLVRAPSENTQTLTGERWDKKNRSKSPIAMSIWKKGSHSLKRHIRI